MIQTVRSLRATGHVFRSIKGVFSGTLSFIFNEFGASERSFSDVVIEAKARGYTEPDPREDLGGNDVARCVGCVVFLYYLQCVIVLCCYALIVVLCIALRATRVNMLGSRVLYIALRATRVKMLGSRAARW